MRRRRGFTLIEVLVVATATAVLLAAAVALIHLLTRLDRADRAAAHRGADLVRLAADLGADAHAARSVEPHRGGEVGLLTLRITQSRTVVYEAKRDRLLRTEREGERVMRRGVYLLPTGLTARWESDEGGSRTLVRLVLDPTPGAKGASPFRGLRIERVLGTSRRFRKESD